MSEVLCIMVELSGYSGDRLDLEEFSWKQLEDTQRSSSCKEHRDRAQGWPHPPGRTLWRWPGRAALIAGSSPGKARLSRDRAEPHSECQGASLQGARGGGPRLWGSECPPPARGALVLLTDIFVVAAATSPIFPPGMFTQDVFADILLAGVQTHCYP